MKRISVAAIVLAVGVAVGAGTLLGIETLAPSPVSTTVSTPAPTSTTVPAPAFEVSADSPRLRRAAKRAVFVVPEVRKWVSGEWAIESGPLPDREAETSTMSECYTTVDVASSDETARTFGVDADEYLALVLAHEAGHCSDDTELTSVKAEHLFAARSGDSKLTKLARCTDEAVDSKGRFTSTEVRCDR
jgi:hypothetical protein